jgi:cobalt-zinc-cadmium efflux system protein
VIVLTGWDRVDPIAGLLVAGLMFWAAYGLIGDSTRVFLEASPGNIDPEDVARSIVAVPEVREVHDLHVWTVTSGFPALAAHIRSDPNELPDEVRERLEAVLHERFGLDHTTLQVVPEPLLQLEDRRRSSRERR